MQDFLVENWKYVVVVVAAIVLFGGEKILAFIKNFKMPSLFNKSTGVKSVNTVNSSSSEAEAEDLEAIMHLRDRAVAIKDKELLLEIKTVSNKIFDLYSQIDKGA